MRRKNVHVGQKYKSSNKKSMISHFVESEIPYGTLERFGLTQEMIEDLPVDVLQNICNGRRSPVLPIVITAEDGETRQERGSALSALLKEVSMSSSIPSSMSMT